MQKTSSKIKLTKQEKEQDRIHAAYSLVGQMGGNATVKKHGKGYMRTIGKRGAAKRWNPRSKKQK